jgi:hypothetical protein
MAIVHYLMKMVAECLSSINHMEMQWNAQGKVRLYSILLQQSKVEYREV